MRGRARLEPDPDYAFADKVGAKYDGTDLRAHDWPRESRVDLTVQPASIHPVNMRGD